MTSPILRAYKGSHWRRDVQTTWAFLGDHCKVLKNRDCSTHVHISVLRGFTLQEIKQIAQCIIHFEPAVEALIPLERQANTYSKSNWIDNPFFTNRDLSRNQAIRRIGACKDLDAVISLMNPDRDRYYGWNFLTMEECKTIEFRKGAASRDASDSLTWAEFAMTFVQSAMQSNLKPDMLSKIPSNIQGLRWFLLQRKIVPGMSDPRYLAPLFANKLPHESIIPHVVRQTTPAEKEVLEGKRESDSRRNAILARTMQNPWI